MAWMNQRNEFTGNDLKSGYLFDLKPGSDCKIRTITWYRSENNAINEEYEEFESEEAYRSWVAQCGELPKSARSRSMVLVMHERLDGQGMKWTSLPYGQETLRQTCQNLKQHRSIAHIVGRASTALFRSRMVEWGQGESCVRSLVYQCRSDTESVHTLDDISVSSTFMLDNSTTLAVMYGCTTEVMENTRGWLNHLKELGLHPMTLPMIFAEIERKRLLEAFSLQKTDVHQRILDIEERITDHSKDSSRLGVKEMTKKDCDSTKLWLRISTLKNGLASLKKQLESMERHSRMLSDTIFIGPEGDHDNRQASGDKFVARLEEMIAELEGNVRACDGLLGGMTLSMQMESNYYARRDADANTDIAKSNIRISEEAKRDSDHMQTISFLGMLFFPGTFFATMFSMSFFKFDPTEGTSGALLSPWFSLYIGLTALSTFLIFVLWKWYTNRPAVRNGKQTDPENAIDTSLHDDYPESPQTASTLCSEGVPASKSRKTEDKVQRPFVNTCSLVPQAAL